MTEVMKAFTVGRITVLAWLLTGIVPATWARDADDFLWLEPPRDAKALEWARLQTAAARRAVESLPVSAAVTAELDSALRAAAPVPDVTLLGDKAVRLLRTSERPFGVLQVAWRDRDGRPGHWRNVLDAGSLRHAGGVPFELQWADEWGRPRDACLPPAYDRCMLRLSIGGSDEAELREFDLARGAFVPDGFQLPSSLSQVAWLNRDTLLVVHTVGTAPRTSAGLGAAVYLWRRGEPIQVARRVLRAEPTDAEIRLLALGSGTNRMGVVVRVVDYSTYQVSLVDQSGWTIPAALPTSLQWGVLATTDQHLVVQLSSPARIGGRNLPAGALLSYDVTSGPTRRRRAQAVYVPAPGEYLADLSMGIVSGSTQVHFVMTRQLLGRMVTATPGARGWTTRAGPAESPGVSQFLVSADPASDDVVVRTSGFLAPDRVEVRRPGREPVLIGAEPVAFDPGAFAVETRTVTSRDGTPVDYYLVRPRAATRTATPTLMTGYGAFGVTVMPAYLDAWVGGRAFKLWLARGGALALPAIRGGGERGTAWHRAAMRQNRQVSYDDFYAVAEALTASGFTDRDHLGVFGASNGGLLAAVAATQRPDLFGAVVVDVPLADMLRFPYMGMGAVWVDEYGDPRDPEMTRVLASYSPVHNVRAGVEYPPFLVTISTSDDRVGPGHGRKLAARLQEAGATAWLVEDEEGGHGVSDALGNPELMAMRMTFLIDRLMPHQDRTTQAAPR
jgi:prolyl oligopeptidase